MKGTRKRFYHVAVLRGVLHLILQRPVGNVGVYLEAIIDEFVVGREGNDENLPLAFVPEVLPEAFDESLEKLSAVGKPKAVGHEETVLGLDVIERILLARRFAEVHVQVEKLHVLLVDE